MDPLSLAASIAGLISLALDASQAVGSYYHAAKGASRSIQVINDELSLMRSVLGQLENLLQSPQMKQSSFAQSSILRTALDSCSQTVQDIVARLPKPSRDTLTRAKQALKWPFDEKEVYNRTQALQRYTSTFQFSLTVEGCTLLSRASEDAARGLKVQLDTSHRVLQLSQGVGTLLESAKEAQALSSQVESILQLISSLHDGVATFEDVAGDIKAMTLMTRESKFHDILDWLSPNKHLTKHDYIRAQRLPDTGQWLLDSAPFQSWLKGGKPVIWCTGGPGAGKSFLTSLVIDHISLKELPSDEALAYFYFDYQDQDQQRPIAFVANILRQLLAYKEVLPHSLIALYDRFRHHQVQAFPNELLDTFRDACLSFNKCYIVIDAFDECDRKDHRKEILNIFRNLHPSPVYLYFTSRPHCNDLSTHFVDREHIQIEASEDDIRSYCYHMMNGSDTFVEITDNSLRKEVAETLSNNAKGMFLLPVLQIQSILESITKSGVRKALRNLSTDLSQAFGDTMRRIEAEPQHRKEVALQSLMWISRAHRQLRMNELRHALATQIGDTCFDQDDLLQAKLIIECCFGLLVIDMNSSIVRLVHYMLQDYLSSRYQQRKLADEIRITMTCLTYLCFDELNGSDFLEYATTCWGYHAQNVPAIEIRALALEYLKSPSKIARARRSASQSPSQRHLHTLYLKGMDGLNIAASFGLCDFIHILLDDGTPILTEDSYATTPVQAAAKNGHATAVMVLVERGAEVDTFDADFNTPLYLAVTESHEKVMMQLLKSGADVDKPCLDEWTALHKAADKGDTLLLSILLDHGASMDARSARGLTALHRAAGRGHLDALKLLLHRGSPIDAVTEDDWTPLHGASSSGRCEAVKVLLDKRATVDFCSEDGRTPLHRACRGGHERTVAALLDGGADFLALDYRGDMPLHRAARGGHEFICRMLLDRDPTQKGNQLSALGANSLTARQQASQCGDWKMAEFLRKETLIALDLDPAIGRGYMQEAIEEGNLHKVSEILGQGYEVNTQISSTLTPLHLALSLGNEEMAGVLLKNGADIKSSNHDGWVPLHCAAKAGLPSAVRLCLAYGADIDSRSNDGQTALHKACRVGSVATAKLLLEEGADIEAQDNQGSRPLHTTAAAGYKGVAEMLISKGANPTALDKEDGEVQHCAARAGHHDLVEYLRIVTLDFVPNEETM